MSLVQYWATLEDFATIFQYLWHKDFPIDQHAVGAQRADWTIHIGIVIRSIADLIGLVARFESGGRTDAVLRSTGGDEIAVEWEWEDVWKANEIVKLKTHKVWSPIKSVNKSLKYAVLITYTHTPNIEKVCKHVKEQWDDAPWPLLLILVDLEESKRYSTGKEFKNLQMFMFDKGGYSKIREAPAFPWNLKGTRWYNETHIQ